MGKNQFCKDIISCRQMEFLPENWLCTVFQNVPIYFIRKSENRYECFWFLIFWFFCAWLFISNIYIWYSFQTNRLEGNCVMGLRILSVALTSHQHNNLGMGWNLMWRSNQKTTGLEMVGFGQRLCRKKMKHPYRTEKSDNVFKCCWHLHFNSSS